MTDIREAGQDATPTQGELKPCPFCGGEAKTYEGKFCSSVKCDNGHAIHEYKPTLDKAIAAWNTRPTDPATDELADSIREFLPDLIDMVEDDKFEMIGYYENHRQVPFDTTRHEAILAALRQSPPAPSEPICETCGFATSHPNASFCSDGFHQPALDPYTLEEAARIAVHIGKTKNGFTYEGYAGTIAAAIRALIPTSKGDTK